MRDGGHAHRTLAQYVTGEVLPLVRVADPDTDTGGGSGTYFGSWVGTTMQPSTI